MNKKLKDTIINYFWAIPAILVFSFVVYLPAVLGMEESDVKNQDISYSDRYFIPINCDSLENYMQRIGLEASGPKWYRKEFVSELPVGGVVTVETCKELKKLSDEYPNWIIDLETSSDKVIFKTNSKKINGQRYTIYPTAALSLILQLGNNPRVE